MALIPHYLNRLRAISYFSCALILLPAAARAQDRPADKVTLQPIDSSSRITISCYIVDFTGETLTLRTLQNTSVRTYDADEVVQVETPQTEHHVKGLDSFAQGDVRQAAESLERALAVESREWVRRDILALLVRCALRQGDYSAAGAKFLALWQSDPKTRQFHLAPLGWGQHGGGEALRGDALGWIALNNDASRLLGASHLLANEKHQALAENELNELASSVHLPIRLLARAQLWRLRVREGNITPAELKRWQSRIDDMPQAIRGGPFYVLGRGHLARKEYDRAAAALLWAPLVYDHDTHLAARACLEAADALGELGQTAEAHVLYREVATRFAATPFADEAQTILKSKAN